MKTLILYASTHGASAAAASFLTERLGACDVVDLKADGAPDMAPYDAVILGGSIRLGRMQSEVRRLADTRQPELCAKRLGLFICCMNDGETAQKQFENAFPESLRVAAFATGLFGGILDFSKMSALERTLVKKIAGVSESVSLLDKNEMERFADKWKGGA